MKGEKDKAKPRRYWSVVRLGDFLLGRVDREHEKVLKFTEYLLPE